MDRLLGLLLLLGMCTGCASLGPGAGKLDLSVVEAHLQSDLRCAGAVGQVFAKAGVQAALASVGLPPNAANQVSSFLGKLSGGMDSSATPQTTLSFVEVCGVLVANVDADITQIKARIAALKDAKRGRAAVGK